jgi:two-component system phosphate regulon sensor histidine kinase PhoR
LIQIDIIDSGTGFSESDLPHVFERLYRGDASRQRQPVTSKSSVALARSSGSGLGLSIVQQIIQAHNGTIKASNHPETGGAWLQIKLPDAKASL